MSKTQKLWCATFAAYTLIAINCLWMGAETLFYGEVQHRIVDDIISIPLAAIIYFMWKFKTERDNLRKHLYY